MAYTGPNILAPVEQLPMHPLEVLAVHARHLLW
jgi:hypothetical protein